MTDQDPHAHDPAPPPASGAPMAASSHGWAIVTGVLVVLLLGVLTALVIDRGDAGATANTAPAISVDLHRTTSTKNVTTTVAAPAPAPSTVTVTPLRVSARVSMPLGWDEVPDCELGDFRIDTVPERLRTVGDPSASIDSTAASLDSLLDLDS